jgi:hypothetical protein
MHARRPGIAEGSHSGVLDTVGVSWRTVPCGVAELSSAWSTCADLPSNSMDLRKKSARAAAASAGRCCGTEDALVCGIQPLGEAVRLHCNVRRSS